MKKTNQTVGTLDFENRVYFVIEKIRIKARGVFMYFSYGRNLYKGIARVF